jgi:hypothetical protein
MLKQLVAGFVAAMMLASATAAEKLRGLSELGLP